jgi:hypothetical protein
MKAQHKQGTGKAEDVCVPEQSGSDNGETLEDPFRLEVKVLNCPSPSCIYVALCSQEEQLKK